MKELSTGVKAVNNAGSIKTALMQNAPIFMIPTTEGLHIIQAIATSTSTMMTKKTAANEKGMHFSITVMKTTMMKTTILKKMSRSKKKRKGFLIT